MCPIGATIPLRDGYPAGLDEAVTAACFSAAPEPLVIVEGERVLFANAAFTALFGCTVPEELVGCCRSAAAARPLCSRVDDTDTGWSQDGHRLCYFAGSRRDGSHTEIEATCSTLEWHDRELVVVSMRDVSHRERRRAVRDSQKRYQAIFQASAMAMLQYSMQGHIQQSNPAAESLFGYPSCELRGMLFSRLIHPEDEAAEQGMFQDLAAGARDSYQLECRYVGKDEKTGWMRCNVSLVRGPAGEPRAAIAMMEDIAERKRAEQQLRDAQKMEAVGRLVGGVSHDFNNLLTGIMLYCDLLLAGLDRDSRLGHHAEEIRLAAEQGAALIQQLLAIARQQVIEPRLLCLNEVVTRTQNLLSRLIGESIAFQIQLEAELGEVRMDPAQVQQILFNLVLNARDAMPRGGRIVVETANCEFAPPGLALPAGSQIPGVALTVSDDGSGMDSNTLSHLFEPFFTTKKPGRGNGLGLATVHDIVQNNGGAIVVESNLGRGTSVRVFLPRVLAPASLVPEARFSQGPIGETILLLEDNLTVRKAAEHVLTECGYRVLEAANGVDAMALAESYPGTVDLVLADVDLPGMSGREVARRLSAARPSLKSLYMSGYKLIEDEDPGSNDSVVFFPKPFTGAVLLQRVREILDAHPAPASEKESQI
jgi:PAS domain S-box-containing protein